jgi:flagellum-specific peptidoglycan hydrolase FlgJ
MIYKKYMPHSYLQVLLVCLVFASCRTEIPEKEDEKDKFVKAYIEKYHHIAKAEMQVSGIPASIKLAQGILESKSGNSELTVKANNHFGIKCGKKWKGKKYQILSDEWDRKKNKMISRKGCFRVYPTVEACYSAHSEILKQKRYKKLFEIDRRDYKNWALGIQKLGYATDPKYAKKIISLIEKFKLYEFDVD